jgi:hypothetical protein
MTGCVCDNMPCCCRGWVLQGALHCVEAIAQWPLCVFALWVGVGGASRETGIGRQVSSSSKLQPPASIRILHGPDYRQRNRPRIGPLVTLRVHLPGIIEQTTDLSTRTTPAPQLRRIHAALPTANLDVSGALTSIPQEPPPQLLRLPPALDTIPSKCPPSG